MDDAQYRELVWEWRKLLSDLDDLMHIRDEIDRINTGIIAANDSFRIIPRSPETLAKMEIVSQDYAALRETMYLFVMRMSPEEMLQVDRDLQDGTDTS